MSLRVLIVCSGNARSDEIFDLKLNHSFIYEQANEIQKKGVKLDFFYIKGKGISGYSKNYRRFRDAINSFKPDIIHAHYGLSGLFANLQRKIPVITTFHGSDVFVFNRNLIFSRIANSLSIRSIVVNKNMVRLLNKSSRIDVIPCGVDLSSSLPVEIRADQTIRGIVKGKLNILFSSRFDYYEKNAPFAKEVINFLGSDYNLVELKGYKREEVNLLMNLCDVAFMPSISEGSPMFIKEAMACNCPIVAADVGDIRDIVGNTNGCFLISYDKFEAAEKLKQAIQFRKQKRQTNGRERIIELGLDSVSIAERIVRIYKMTTSN